MVSTHPHSVPVEECRTLPQAQGATVVLIKSELLCLEYAAGLADKVML